MRAEEKPRTECGGRVIAEPFVAYLIQALAARSAEYLPDPPTPRQMHRTLLRLYGSDAPRSR
jgi:hypothetical protein